MITKNPPKGKNVYEFLVKFTVTIFLKGGGQHEEFGELKGFVITRYGKREAGDILGRKVDKIIDHFTSTISSMFPDADAAGSTPQDIQFVFNRQLTHDLRTTSHGKKLRTGIYFWNPETRRYEPFNQFWGVRVRDKVRRHDKRWWHGGMKRQQWRRKRKRHHR